VAMHVGYLEKNSSLNREEFLSKYREECFSKYREEFLSKYREEFFSIFREELEKNSSLYLEKKIRCVF
jgi:hypothetical protein